MALSYRDVYEQRVASGEAKGKPKGDNNSMEIPGVIDKSNTNVPKVPDKSATPLPVDDAPYRKMRTQQA